MRRVKPDIIHAHFGFDGYRMMKPALKNNIPLITSFYGSDVSRLPTEFDWRRRYRKLAKNGDAFIAVSNLMKTQLIQLGFPEEKIHFIPFGLDVEAFIFSGHSKSNSLMMVGRMVEKKGFKYALEAVKRLKEQNIKVHLDLYGDGPLEKQLKKIACKWKIEDQVTFHGYTSVEQIKKEHQKHQILLAPSVTADDGDEEGLPNTILEAMALGTLVIASDHAAIGEAVMNNKTGLLVPEGNAEALADLIKFALENVDQAREMKQQARALIKDKFEIRNVVNQIEALYATAIDEHSVQKIY